MKKKYVIYDYCFPVIFTEGMAHDSVKTGREPTSAGFFNVRPDTDPNANGFIHVTCYGESVSLNLKPSDFDSRILESFLN
jgi:hypothetical protein